MLTTLALALVVGLVAIIVVAWWRQERITYQPPPPPYDDPGATPVVRYEADDGQPLFGLLVGSDTTDRPLLLAFHGNADLAVWQLDWARELARRTGWRVLLVEYRGYGGLGGSPTYPGIQRDARAAWEYARRELGARPERTALFGHSLGSAVAAELAADIPPAALVLQSPFTSARDMARIIVARPVMAVYQWISRVHYDTEARVRAIDAPVHVAHGTRDFLVPNRMGRRVHAAAKRPGQLLLVPGAGHNDVPDVGGDAYWAWITQALVLPGNSSPVARDGVRTTGD